MSSSCRLEPPSTSGPSPGDDGTSLPLVGRTATRSSPVTNARTSQWAARLVLDDEQSAHDLPAATVPLIRGDLATIVIAITRLMRRKNSNTSSPVSPPLSSEPSITRIASSRDVGSELIPTARRSRSVRASRRLRAPGGSRTPRRCLWALPRAAPGIGEVQVAEADPARRRLGAGELAFPRLVHHAPAPGLAGWLMPPSTRTPGGLAAAAVGTCTRLTHGW